MHRCFSRENMIDLLVSLFPNKKILDDFSESSDSSLLYKGNPITADMSDHEGKNVNSQDGIHGLRYYNQKLQYYNGQWNDIATGGIVDKDIVISPNVNNALKKFANGYFVQEFLVSSASNNAIVKKSDGYYVKAIIDYITEAELKNTQDSITEYVDKKIENVNNQYDTIIEKINAVQSSSTKIDELEYKGKQDALDLVVDISSLHQESQYVILNTRILIQNASTTEELELLIKEQGIETLHVSLKPLEVQSYDLDNASKICIYIKGHYEMYLRITHI